MVKLLNYICLCMIFPGSDDLMLIMQHLLPIASNWKWFGIQLELSSKELDTIAATPLLIPGGPAAYIQEVLSRWLKRAPFPTLTDLCDALSAIDQRRIAHELKQYQTEKAGMSAVSASRVGNTNTSVKQF